MAKEVAKMDAKAQAMAVYDYGDAADEGKENIKGVDISIPFLAILQPMSPIVVDGTVEGAKPGMIYNTATGELWDAEVTGNKDKDAAKGVPFVRVHNDKKFIEWIPRAAGGGIAGDYEDGSPEVLDAIRDAGGRYKPLKVGDNDLVETHYIHGLTLTADGAEPTGFATMAAKSTNIKAIKDWNLQLLSLKGVPTYATRCKLVTVKDKNDQGTWYKLKVVPFNPTGWRGSQINPAAEAHVIEAARDFRQLVLSGVAKVDYSQEKASGEPVRGNGEPVPF